MILNRKFLIICLVAVLAHHAGAKGPAKDREDFRFVVLGDRTNLANQQAFETVLEDVGRLRPDLVVTVGDLIQGYKDSAGTAGEWDSLLPLLKALACPVYLTPGNHDITTPGVRGLFSLKTGFQPYYSFNYGSHHFVILDNSLAATEAKLDQEQVRWLEKDLADCQNKCSGIYVFMHRPFWPFGVGAGRPDKLHALFKKHGVAAVFTGHWHRYASEVYDGIRYVVMGSSGAELRQGAAENVSLANFYQFLWVTVKDGRPYPALIRSGNTFDPGHVSLEEETFAHRMPDQAVRLTGSPVKEGRTPKAWEAELRLANLTPKTIRGEVTWETGANWRPVSERTKLEVLPGDTFRARFRFEGPGVLYPLPGMNFTYPFGRDKVYNIQNHPPDVVKETECPAAAQRPVLDGKVSPGEWAGAARITEFCDPGGRPAQTDPTEVYLMHSGDFLYLAAVCHEAEMPGLKSGKTTRDSRVTDDDHIGFLFASGRDTVRLAYFNPRGTVWDRLIDRRQRRNNDKWDGRFLVAATRGQKSWQIEIRIPAADLGLSGLSNDAPLRMNVRRRQQSSGYDAIWVYGWSHDPERFGIVKFR
jgi:predicted phosphodiesterase